MLFPSIYIISCIYLSIISTTQLLPTTYVCFCNLQNDAHIDMAPSSPDHTSNAVCVMDASTPLGTALVDHLLRLDFTVHAAVHTNIGEFMFKGYDNKRLKIFHSDPFDYHSILEGLRGCCGLFYTFDPPQHQPTFDDEMMMMMMGEEEARAAHNVLEACAQTDTIDKIVFTSAVTAVIWGHDANYSTTSISHLDERFWSDPHFCRKFKLWHGLSKTLAEKTAWALAMDRGVNMVSVNAGLLVDSGLTLDNPYLKGAAEMYESGLFVTVDLNYLVEAHIRIFQDLSSYGRYICFNHIINTHDKAADLARKLTPLPLSEEQQSTRVIPPRISNQKLNKLLANFKGGRSNRLIEQTD